MDKEAADWLRTASYLHKGFHSPDCPLDTDTLVEFASYVKQRGYQVPEWVLFPSSKKQISEGYLLSLLSPVETAEPPSPLKTKPGCAFLFPGQGSHAVGMGKGITSAKSLQLFERAKAVLGYDLFRICTEGTMSELEKVSQVAIYVCALAFAYQLQENQPVVKPKVAAGLSLGEYTALVYANLLSFEEGLQLVAERTAIMKETVTRTGAMIFVAKCTEAQLLEKMLKTVDIARDQGIKEPSLNIANYLSRAGWVVAGDAETCKVFQEVVAKQEPLWFTKDVAVSSAFHTHLMEPCLAPLQDMMSKKNWKAPLPGIDVLSNTDCHIHSDPYLITDSMVKHVVEPVRWDLIMDKMVDVYGCNIYYLMGANLAPSVNAHMRCLQKTNIEVIEANKPIVKIIK